MVIVSYLAPLFTKVICASVERRSYAMPQNLNNGADADWNWLGRFNVITRQGLAARLKSPVSEGLFFNAAPSNVAMLR